MIKKFIDKLLGKQDRRQAGPSRRRPGIPRRGRSGELHGIDLSLVDERAVKVVKTLRGRDRGLHRRRRGARPAGRPAARRTSTSPPTPRPSRSRAVPARLHHRAALPHRARGVRPRARARGDRGVDLPRLMDAAAAEQVSGNEKTSKAPSPAEPPWSTPAAACCATTSGARRIEDATRRDFTVNAMYHDPQTQWWSTTTAAWRRRREEARAAHDRRPGHALPRGPGAHHPRACALRPSSSGFRDRAKETRAHPRRWPLLGQRAAESRLFDEMIKLLQTGHALASIGELQKQGLHRGVFPVLDAVLEGRAPRRAAPSCAGAGTPTAASARASRGAQLHAGLHAVARRAGCAGRNAWPRASTVPGAAAGRSTRCLRRAHRRHLRPRQAGADMREIWMMQPRFERRTGSSAPFSLVEQPLSRRFRLPAPARRRRRGRRRRLAEWWEDFSLGDDEEREAPDRAGARARRPAQASGAGRWRRRGRPMQGEANPGRPRRWR